MQIVDLLKADLVAKIEEINKGWSFEKKLFVQFSNGKKCLLRISPIENFTKKAIEFDAMSILSEKGLPIPKPLDIKGVEEEVFSLFEWVEGQDLNEVIPLLSDKEQYRLGVVSGTILKEIHQLELPKVEESWAIRYDKKINRNIENYKKSTLRYDSDSFFFDVIDKNRQLIKKRPTKFQHGDYHTGNMILSEDKTLKVIDFNRFDYGDPWEEFNRIDFTVEMSPLFATGQLHGYFEGEPTSEFFKLLQLYISVNALNALPWAEQYSVKDVETMKEKANHMLEWYTDRTTDIPSWYKEVGFEGH